MLCISFDLLTSSKILDISFDDNFDHFHKVHKTFQILAYFSKLVLGLQNLRTLKRRYAFNQSFFGWYSLALRDFCREENRLLAFKVNKPCKERGNNEEKVVALTGKLTPFSSFIFEVSPYQNNILEIFVPQTCPKKLD